MKLQELIPELYEDYHDLMTKGYIGRAVKLSKEYSALLGTPFYFSHTEKPHYPVRNFDAQTVFVHLNPGVNLGQIKSLEDFHAQKWDKENYYNEFNLPYNASLDQVIEKYCYFWQQYAYKRFEIDKVKDNFDYKQACFLLHWPDSGIELINGNLKDVQIQKQNSINVIDQKLQLELFPYGSNTISTHLLDDVFSKKPELITPFIERILNIIDLYPRKYVLFGSRVYDTLFRMYDNRISKIIEYISPEEKFKNITTKSLAFTFIRLKWNGRLINAGIAHSFPRRDLPNAYEKMAEYGRMCHKTYNKFLNS